MICHDSAPAERDSGPQRPVGRPEARFPAWFMQGSGVRASMGLLGRLPSVVEVECRRFENLGLSAAGVVRTRRPAGIHDTDCGRGVQR